MKIPAMRAEMGGRTFYISTLTFEQISSRVSAIDKQLHKSEALNDMIQRSISKNYLNIKDYILNQSEMFFNSLILAVYDSYPEWNEVEFKFDDETTFQIGLLSFPNQHKIFPVDGQHRVEGIKAALLENPDLKSEKISVIFIGHLNTSEGMQKTRRLFTTLNRYAKPVSLDDSIALDEDDIVAIITRNLLEDYDLFMGKRIVYAEQKGISSNNKFALTSIITFYQCNVELFRCFYYYKFDKKASKSSIDKFLKYRPEEDVINDFKTYTIEFWDAFKSKLFFISEYLRREINPVGENRNQITGGNMVFRPIGLLPLVKSSITISQLTGKNFSEIFERFNELDFNLNSKPWIYVLWNPVEHKMHNNEDTLTQLLLIFLFDRHLLTESELKKLKLSYASKISYDGDINNDNFISSI
ncbi:DGQHR domain-containing protein [Pedobacter sp. MC2016-14]|uniref:DNA sulfur modification protein DndB n=1 Tax=Pedobacter sp. MC2016-14 TaxID=2897327 RepID=UPI001E436387|nr:DNA sulfur modification protein DndB [Pedobacter sp. MC2016-14]MCD0487920.1 DGQHR domain-containing protein [Pedobacter sp. MC2016-14]